MGSQKNTRSGINQAVGSCQVSEAEKEKPCSGTWRVCVYMCFCVFGTSRQQGKVVLIKLGAQHYKGKGRKSAKLSGQTGKFSPSYLSLVICAVLFDSFVFFELFPSSFSSFKTNSDLELIQTRISLQREKKTKTVIIMITTK